MPRRDIIPRGERCFTKVPLTLNDGTKLFRICYCPYLFWRSDEVVHNKEGYCKYLNRGDWDEAYSTMLWDCQKACNENYEEE
jgi:hypothetical protein